MIIGTRDLSSGGAVKGQCQAEDRGAATGGRRDVLSSSEFVRPAVAGVAVVTVSS